MLEAIAIHQSLYLGTRIFVLNKKTYGWAKFTDFAITMWAIKDKFTKMAKDLLQAISSEKLITDFD